MIKKIRIKKAYLLEFIFIQILIYSPIASIFGNLLPKMGLFKFSWLYWVLILFIGLLLLIKHKEGRKYLSLLFLFIILNIIFSDYFGLKIFINIIISLNTIMVIYILLKKNFFSEEVMKILLLQFFLQFILIFSISLGQFFNVIPLKLTSGGFVSTTHLEDGSVAERLNGFFYHPFDLSIYFYFTFLFFFFYVSAKWKYWVLLSLLILMFFVKIKMGFVLSLLILLTYFLFFDRRYRKQKIISTIFVVILVFYSILNFLPEKQLQHFSFSFSFPYFDSQFLTGRGSIWNIYIKGIFDNFSISNYLFGYGFSTKELFLKTMTPELWYPASRGLEYTPAPHNLFLQVFIVGGLFLFGIIIFLLKKLYSLSKNKQYFMFVIVFPLLTYGSTASILDVNLYWSLTMVSFFFILGFQRIRN